MTQYDLFGTEAESDGVSRVSSKKEREQREQREHLSKSLLIKEEILFPLSETEREQAGTDGAAIPAEAATRSEGAPTAPSSPAPQEPNTPAAPAQGLAEATEGTEEHYPSGIVEDAVLWPPGTPLAHREVMMLAVRHLLPAAGLAAPVTLVIGYDGDEHIWTSDRERHALALKRREVVFSPLELLAAAVLLEAGVPIGRSYAEWVLAKTDRPGWRLTATKALGHPLTAEEWSALEREADWGYTADEGFGVVHWLGDYHCPGHWMLNGVTVGRLLSAVTADLNDVGDQATHRGVAA